ncbi:ATP-dependent DNA helicase [Trichonephila clavipes]|nr:ATP-dependent DNA helicase [Trichonephila clavipes]
MRVRLKDDPYSQIFSSQFLGIGNGEVELHPNTQCIQFPGNFCTVVPTNDLIYHVSTDILRNFPCNNWLSNRGKEVAVGEINFNIQKLLLSDRMSFKSIHTVVD